MGVSVLIWLASWCCGGSTVAGRGVFFVIFLMGDGCTGLRDAAIHWIKVYIVPCIFQTNVDDNGDCAADDYADGGDFDGTDNYGDGSGHAISGWWVVMMMVLLMVAVLVMVITVNIQVEALEVVRGKARM